MSSLSEHCGKGSLLHSDFSELELRNFIGSAALGKLIRWTLPFFLDFSDLELRSFMLGGTLPYAALGSRETAPF